MPPRARGRHTSPDLVLLPWSGRVGQPVPAVTSTAASAPPWIGSSRGGRGQPENRYATPGTVQEWLDTFGGLPDRDEHSVIPDLDAMREQAEEREQEDGDEQRT